MTDRILLVEDERAQREALASYLVRAGYAAEGVATAEEALVRLQASSYALLVTDLRLPGMDGLELVRRARVVDEEMPVLLTTAYASVESAIEALRIGAQDYLLKPLILEEVARKAAALLSHRELLRENARLRSLLSAGERPHEVVATSAAMQEVLAWVRRAAATRATVLVTGETGTGKEVVARAIHSLGASAHEPFLALNVAALPETLVESELFGHERGAFTGADRKREGILRGAGAGTVFLDEVAELSTAAQAKLLRALETREVQPLGSDRSVPFEARVLAATHRDLGERIGQGLFREDLFYRLNVVRIHIPPLRERPDDVPALAHQILRRLAARSGVPVPVLTAEALRALCRYAYRGNVRELANVLERALILADDGRIDLDQLPADVPGSETRSLRLDDAVERFERSHVALVLKDCGGNREKAAEEMGISPATLYRRLEKLGLKGTELAKGAVRE